MIVSEYLLSLPSSKLTIHAEQQSIRITVNQGNLDLNQRVRWDRGREWDYIRSGETVDENAGASALDEPGSIVLVDGDLVSFPAGDVGEPESLSLTTDQAGVLCASTCARRGCGVRRGCHAGRCPLLLQRSRAGRGGRTGLGSGARGGGGAGRDRGGVELGRPCSGMGQSAERKAVWRRSAVVLSCGDRRWGR